MSSLTTPPFFGLHTVTNFTPRVESRVKAAEIQMKGRRLTAATGLRLRREDVEYRAEVVLDVKVFVEVVWPLAEADVDLDGNIRSLPLFLVHVLHVLSHDGRLSPQARARFEDSGLPRLRGKIFALRDHDVLRLGFVGEMLHIAQG